MLGDIENLDNTDLDLSSIAKDMDFETVAEGLLIAGRLAMAGVFDMAEKIYRKTLELIHMSTDSISKKKEYVSVVHDSLQQLDEMQGKEPREFNVERSSQQIESSQMESQSVSQSTESQSETTTDTQSESQQSISQTEEEEDDDDDDTSQLISSSLESESESEKEEGRRMGGSKRILAERDSPVPIHKKKKIDTGFKRHKGAVTSVVK